MDAARGGGARRCPSASAGTSRRSRLWVGGRGNEAADVIKAILAEHPRDVVLLQRLYFIHFWQGRSADMLDLTRSVRRRLRRGLLRARAARLQPRGEPALRRGAGPGRAGDGAQSEGRVGRPCHGPRALRAGGQCARHRGPAPAHPSLRSSRLLQESSALAPRPHAPGRGALRAGGAPLPGRVRRHRRSRSDPTFRIPCRSRGGSTSSAIRIRGAGSIWARRRARGSTCRSCSSTTLTWRWRSPPRAIGHRPSCSSIACASGARRRGTPRCPRSLVPLIEGLHAFARGDYRAAVDRIEPIDARIVEVGGSHAQRELFHDTLLAAALRAELHERARPLLDRAARQAPQSRPLLDDGATPAHRRAHAHDRREEPGRGGGVMAAAAQAVPAGAGTAVSGLSIRRGTARDVPVILELIRGLAEYERLLHQVEATPALIRRHGFGRRPYFETLICRRGKRACRLRALLLHLLDVSGPPEPLPRGPVRSPRGARPRRGQGAAEGARQDRRGARLRPHGVGGARLEPPRHPLLQAPRRRPAQGVGPHAHHR